MRISYWSSDVCSSDLKILINKHAKSLFEAWFLPSYIPEDDGPKQQKHHVQAKNNRKIVHAEPPLPTSSQGQDTEPCSVRLEAHTSELQSLMRISYAVFCSNKQSKHTATNAAK